MRSSVDEGACGGRFFVAEGIVLAFPGGGDVARAAIGELRLPTS